MQQAQFIIIHTYVIRSTIHRIHLRVRLNYKFSALKRIYVYNSFIVYAYIKNVDFNILLIHCILIGDRDLKPQAKPVHYSPKLRLMVRFGRFYCNNLPLRTCTATVANACVPTAHV